MTATGTVRRWDFETVMYRALIIDNDAAHANGLRELLLPHNLTVDRASDPEQAIAKLRRGADEYVLVIVTISDTRSLWGRILGNLQAACRRENGSLLPLFLCIGRAKLGPEFILQLERLGTRYVRER